MSNQIKDILLKFDEPDRYETPSKFDYQKLKLRVIELKEDLESNFELTFQIDDQIQDASFFCDFKIPKELVIGFKSDLGYSIRISNYGGLATINFEEEYSEGTNIKIKGILERHNFFYLSFNDLDQNYDGRFKKFHEIYGGNKPSWYNRYFDYL